MAGNWSRLKNDNCQNKLQLEESLRPGNYALFKGAHEVNLESSYISPESGIQSGCHENANAEISNMWSCNNQGIKVDIENDLLDLDQATKCVADKHKMCTPESNDRSCNVGVPAMPALCERVIVPTNMRMPPNCGF